jgi:hypothetical protein
MNHFFKIISSLLLAVVVLSACNKYEDGPKFSLMTKKARLTGEWVVEEYTVDGVDHTADFNSTMGAYVLEIEKDGKYRTEGNYPDSGTWELGEDKDDIFLDSDAEGVDTESYRITRLKNKELWVKHSYSDGTVSVFHYKAK